MSRIQPFEIRGNKQSRQSGWCEERKEQACRRRVDLHGKTRKRWVGDEVGIQQYHVMKDLAGHDKDFEIYSVCSGKLLEGLLQGGQWYGLTNISKDHSGCCRE